MSAVAWKVAVTRDEGDEPALAGALRARGLTPVSCPAVATAPPMDPAPLETAARELERYDWLVVASVRAVDALVAARGGAPLPPGLRTAAVGESTAARLVRHGASRPLTAPRAGARALAEALRDADRWPGRRCLLPRALEGGVELARELRALGAEVHDVVAYRTLERPADALRADWTAASPDAAVVASPSAARALVRALGSGALGRLAAVVAIGPTTQAALATLGVRAAAAPRADFTSAAEWLAGALPDTERRPS